MENTKTTLSEKFYYAFGNMGGYILWAFIGTYVTIYVTDCIKPGDYLISIFGTIVLACRLFDGFSDIIMGLIIEKTNSRIGKARFWYGVSIIPLTIIFILIFLVSGLDKTTSIITISILYFLFTVIFYTMNNVSFNTLLPRISNDKNDQSNICTINSVFTSVGSLVCAVAIPILGLFGGESLQSSWTILVIILAILAIVGQIVCFIKIKEKKEIVVTNKEHQDSKDIKKGLKALFKSKYFYIAIIMFCINYYLSLSATSIGKYYAQYVLGNKNYFSLFGSLPMITMGIGLICTPIFVSKFNKKNTLIMAVSCVFIGNLIGAIFPYSFAASLTGVMIKGLGSAVVMSQLFTLAPDIVRYIEVKDGIRVEGLAASANSFGSKIGSGLGSAVVLWALALCGYVAEADTQSSGVINTFISLYWWIPCILSLILLLLASLWNIDKKTNEIQEKNNSLELTKEL